MVIFTSYNHYNRKVKRRVSSNTSKNLHTLDYNVISNADAGTYIEAARGTIFVKMKSDSTTDAAAAGPFHLIVRCTLDQMAF